MAGKKVSALPAAGSVSSSDTIVVVQSGVTKKATVSQLPSSGSSFTAPTGTGLMTVTSGSMDAAAATLGSGFLTWAATPSGANLASLLTSALPVSKGGTGLTSLTIPASTLLVGTTDAQTLTNKTILGADNTLEVRTQDLVDTDANVQAWMSSPTGGNLASALTTALPVSAGGTGLTALGTALYLIRVNAAGTALEYVAPSSGGSSVGSAGAVQISDGAGDFDDPGDVVAGSGYVSIGAAPVASAGAIRLANAGKIAERDVGDTDDVCIAMVSTANRLHLGHNSGYTEMAGEVNIFPLSGIALGLNGGNYFDLNSGACKSYKPIIGAGVAQGAVNGLGDQAMANANQTPTSAVYCYSVIRCTSVTMGATRDLILPDATDATAYTKIIRNEGNQSVRVIDVSGGSSVTIATARTAIVYVCAAGVLRATADTAH